MNLKDKKALKKLGQRTARAMYELHTVSIKVVEVSQNLDQERAERIVKKAILTEVSAIGDPVFMERVSEEFKQHNL